MSISIRWRKLYELQGWRAGLACYVSGALMAFAFAPFFYWPVIVLSLGIFYPLIEGAVTWQRAALRGFLFGYGYFMAGTWWIANSMLVDVAKFGWMIPLSIGGLSAVLALWFALFGVLIQQLRSAQVLANLLRFAVFWVVVEYLRSLGIFGFPWNLAGYVALASLHVAQVGSLVGVFGLSFIVILTSLLPLLWFMETSPRRRWAGVIAAVLLLGVVYGYGALRIPETTSLTSTTLRLVQPSIPQAIKGTAEGKREAMRILMELSGKGAQRPEVTLWSESAFPIALRGPETGLVWPYSGVLISGAVRVEQNAEKIRLYNSIVTLGADGVVQQWYDKHQLVPFGEFVPLRNILPLAKITPGDIDFSRGAGVRTVMQGALPPFSPLVCYEVIFPWIAADQVQRPAWIFNATNDGWYGDSPGPYQHFAMARMRAIEQGLPLVRVANNGISGVIDPYGRVTASLPLNARDAIDANLPAALPPTFYASFGEWPILIIMIFLMVLANQSFFRKRIV